MIMGILQTIYKSIRGSTPHQGIGGDGSRRRPLSFLFAGQNYDYSPVEQLGLWRNAVMASGIDWLARNWNVPNLQVVKVDDKGIETPIPLHPALRLFRRPHRHMGQSAFTGTIVRDLLTRQGVWVEKVMSRTGRVTELRLWDSTKVGPVFPADGSAYLTHWKYEVNGRQFEVPASRVIYLRRYVNPEPNMDRMGWVPSLSHIRGIAALNEADRYIAALLRNFCVPGIIASPKGDFTISAEDAKAIVEALSEQVGGEGIGRNKVLTGSYDIHKIAFSPEEAGLIEIPKRLTALVLSSIGLNMDVLGLNIDGSGAYGSYAEAIRAAYVHGLIPLQAMFADEMTHQLLVHYEDEEDILDGKIRFAWDYSPVEELDEREQIAANRAIRLYAAGTHTMNECRDITGYPPVQTPDADLLGIDRDKARIAAGLAPIAGGKVSEGDGLGGVKVPASGQERSKLEGERKSDALSPSRSGINKEFFDASSDGNAESDTHDDVPADPRWPGAGSGDLLLGDHPGEHGDPGIGGDSDLARGHSVAAAAE